jgi:HAD superfamily hydrolase (TIGR01509 family)
MTPLANLAHALHGKRLLIFDFDGTVADTSPLHAAAFAQALAPLGIGVDYPSIAGMKTLDAMYKCLERAGRSLTQDEVTALAAAKQKCVREMISQGLQPLPGVDDFLRWAKPRYQLAMVTSGSRETVSLALEKLGYTNWFSPLICADELKRAKPDPEGFSKALQLTGVPAGEALVFEDSEAGLAAANAAGVSYFDVRSHLVSDLISDSNAIDITR